METSVLIQVPYELEKIYSPLEERDDIDYAVMSVDNFNVGDFLMGLYITISSDPVAAGVMSGMIWDTVKIIVQEVFSRLVKSSGSISQRQFTQARNEQETCVKVSLTIKENPKKEYRMDAEYTINRPLNDDDTNKISGNMLNQLKEMAMERYETSKKSK